MTPVSISSSTVDAVPRPPAGPLRIALLGNPNCGKTALFNLLTGSRQKVANYAGVTVERKEGTMRTPGGREVSVLDLPGVYGLNAMSLDEAVTREAMLGTLPGERRPDLVVCVVDATNLRLNLRLVAEVRRLGLPMLLALNMTDVAERRGIRIDDAVLARELGMPVVRTVAVRRGGARALLDALDGIGVTGAVVAVGAVVAIGAAGAVGAAGAGDLPRENAPAARGTARLRLVSPPRKHDAGLEPVLASQREAARLWRAAVTEPVVDRRVDDTIDRVVLHPVAGTVLLAAVLFLMFQAVFSWAAAPMEAIEAGVGALGQALAQWLPDGPLRSLLVDGVIAGAGSVLVFLPQILILFLFILALEDSGYLPRAAFLLDRLMGTVGLSGRSFIPLLSSFACAVPGVMATRTIGDWRDRLVTIMIAPLMTCSARLPVYALLIGAFVPPREVWGGLSLQGLVLFGLYLAGIVSAMGVALVMKSAGARDARHPLLLELPSYRPPNLRNLGLGIWERARIFMGRVGTIILSMMVLMWFLASFPAPPEGATGPAIGYSFAGMVGRALEPLFAPLGFNWQISVALVPGMAAREVAVGALGTVYALSASGDDTAAQLAPVIAQGWSLATALSLLAWFVYAPQCLSTLVAVRRETGSWRYPLVMAAYLFGLAYAAAFVTYRVALALGAG